MKRIYFLTYLFLVTLFAYAAKPTNILFIHMEDMGCQIPAYGDMTQETPHLSQLAKEGLTVETAHVTAPTCASSRGSLFTGLYPHQNGIMGFIKMHGFDYHEGTPTFIQALKKKGYATAISYKTGVSPESYVPFDEIYNYAKDPLDGNKASNHKVTNCINAFEHFLMNRAKDDKPFYFQAQTNDTHTPWRPPYEPIKGMETRFGFHPIKAEQIDLKNFPQLNVESVKINTKAKEFLALYYGAIQRTDYYVGQILGLLKKYGHEDNTLVIFTADHGPSHVFKGKTTPYEFGLRVPFIVKWPGKVKPNTKTKNMVSFVDLAPTFLEVAGAEVPNHLPGSSLVPTFTQGRKVRDYLFSAYVTHTTGKYEYWPARTIRGERYKLIHHLIAHKGGREKKEHGIVEEALNETEAGRAIVHNFYHPQQYELFDLQNDPGESVNLYDNPQYKKIRDDLKAKLENWGQNVVKDPFLKKDYLDAFTLDYYKGCQEFDSVRKKYGKSFKSSPDLKTWRIDKQQWIHTFDPSIYGLSESTFSE